MLFLNRLIRLAAGLTVMILTLVVVFSILLPMAHHWGATKEEINAALPGDELLDHPLVYWTNGITIHAPPEKVWPWIIQIGEGRGGYYSYTFIENTFVGKELYHNADRIIPEFQNPSIGEVMIGDMLKIREYTPEQYLLADSVAPDLGWTWVWNISPVGNGQTRLVIRNRVQPFTEAGNPAMILLMDIGGFAMEQKMMQGIKLRAEGYSEAGYIQTLEYALWLGALLTGLAAGLVYLIKTDWKKPLLVGIASVVVLPIFTIVQPPVWLRVGIGLALLAGLAWSILPSSKVLQVAKTGRPRQNLESA